MSERESSDGSSCDWCFLDDDGDSIHIQEVAPTKVEEFVNEIATEDVQSGTVDLNAAVLESDDTSHDWNSATLVDNDDKNNTLNGDKDHDAADITMKDEMPENLMDNCQESLVNFETIEQTYNDSSSDISIIDEESDLSRPEASNVAGGINNTMTFSNVMRPTDMLQCMTASQSLRTSAESRPIKTSQSQTTPAEIRPTKTSQSQTTPAEIRPITTSQLQMILAEIRPTKTSQSQTTSAEIRPIKTSQSQTTAAEIRPIQTFQSQMASVAIRPIKTTQSQTTSAVIRPIKTSQSQATSAEIRPTKTSQSQTTSAEIRPTKTAGKQEGDKNAKKKKKKKQEEAAEAIGVLIVVCLFCVFGLFALFNSMMGQKQAYDDIYTDILACIGKKHLDAAKNDTEHDVQNMCLNETVFRSRIENHLHYYNLSKRLFQIQGMLAIDDKANISKFLAIDVSHIDMKLVIQHLEHFEILPIVLNAVQVKDKSIGMSKRNDIPEKETSTIDTLQEAMINLTEQNRNWQKQVLFLIHQRNNFTVQSMRSRIRRSISEADQHRTTRTSIELKLQELLDQNVELKAEINSLREFAKNNVTYVNVEDLTTDLGSSANYTLQLDSLLQNMEDIKSRMIVLQAQIASKEETSGVEEMMKNIDTIVAKVEGIEQVFLNLTTSQFQPESSESSSWQWLKTKVDNVVEEAQKGYNEAVNRYKNTDFEETISIYAKDGQEHAEAIVDAILQNLETVQKKTEEVIKENIDVDGALDSAKRVADVVMQNLEMVQQKTEEIIKNIDVDAALSSAKDVWDSFQDKLTTVTNEIVDEFTKEFPKEKKSAEKDKKTKSSFHKKVEKVQSFLKKKWNRFTDKIKSFAPKYKVDKSKDEAKKEDHCDAKEMKCPMPKANVEEGNWYFQRAAERHVKRGKHQLVNWYLRREIHRERLRQRQKNTPPLATPNP